MLGDKRLPSRDGRARRRGDVTVLLVPEPAIDLAPFQQLVVLADLLDLAALQHENRVRIHERRQPMRNHDHRPPLRDPADVFVDDRLAVRIERACRLVEDEDLRVEDQRARDRQALPLAARQIGRALVNIGLVAARQPVDEFLRAGKPRRAHDFVECRVRLGGGDVFADRAAEEKVLLQDHAETAAKVRNVVFAHVDAVDLD